MDKTTAERIAKRFVGLPLEQRRQILDKMRETGQGFRLLPIAVTRHDTPRIPLSYAQQRMLFLWQMAPDDSAYNVPMAVRLNGTLDQDGLGRALHALVQRHEALRTRFVSEEGAFHQEILDQVPVALEVTEVANEALLQAQVQAELQAPFDLLGGNLLRARLFRLGASEHVLTLCMHHVVSDGWSGQLLVREFVQLYQGEISGQPAQLPALAIQYADYAIWQRAWLEAGEGERQLDYWKQQLGDEQPVLSLPLDHERPLQPSHRGAVLRADLPAALSAQLKQLARGNGQTLFMLVLAAMAVVLSRYSGQADVRIGAPNAGRTRSELEGLIGFFINTQVLRIQVDERQTFAALLEQVKQVVSGAQSHQELPFEHLVDALLPERNLGHNPLFQFKINQQVAGADDGEGGSVEGLSVEKYASGSTDARFDLAYDFVDGPDGVRGYFTYATDLFEAATIERIAGSLRRVLENLVAHTGEAVLGFPEQAAQLAAAQAPALAGGNFIALWQHGLQAGRGKLALRAGEQTLDYDQLEAQSNQLAGYLQAQGVAAGQTVALCQERGIEWVVSLLAVLKLGAVYLPLDTRQPKERLRQLVRDSGAVLLIQGGDLDLGCPSLGWNPQLWAACDTQAPAVQIHAEQPAYLIYTSGSTGQPKGVVISHGALANYVQAVLERQDLDADASLAMVSTIAADLGHTMLFGALAAGRPLHLLSHEHAFDPDRFAAYMAEQRIDVLKIVPSHLQGLLQAANAADVLPRQLLVLGGEASSWSLVEQVRSLKPGCRILNHYGPTETTVGILTHEVGARLDGCRSVPVGQPLANATAQVLDAWLNPVAERVAGELYLGGQGLAQGYLGQPALTAERFVPAENGQRRYRAGDRARQVDGVLEYLGRADDQVKIRGYRVEPGEVGHLLQGLAGVAEAVVLALPQDSDETRLQLVGYCVAASGVSLDGEALRQQLAASLPEYLVPAQILLLERLPLTANGKLDKRALPKPGAVKQRYVAPSGEIEEKLAAIWRDVLKLEQVGSTDNFFELGGDSILSLQIIARAKRQGIKLSPKQLFEKQTIGQLASVAKLIEKKAAAPAPVQISGRLPLLPIQARFFDTAIPERQHWNQAVMLKPTRVLDPVHLQAALHALIEQHDALRLSFQQQAADWQASFAPANSAGVLWVRELDDVGALRELANEAQRSLDLKDGPLLRAVLVNLAGGEQRLLLVVHHLVVDGVSWRVLLEDLQSACQQQPLPAKTSSLKDWAGRLHDYAVSPVLEQELGYWQAQLQDVSDALPCDHPEGSQQRRHAVSVSTHLDAELTRKLLQDAPAAYRTQINDLLLSALARVICRWTGQAHALVRLEGHGREDLFDDIDLSRTVGWFSNLFPVRLTPAADLGASIKAIKEQLRAIPNKGIGYGVLRHLGNDAARATLDGLAQGNIVFNYLGQFDGSFTAEDALFAPSGESAGDGQDFAAPLAALLSLNGQVYGGELDLGWSFSSAVFERETVQRLADDYAAELRLLVEHCTRDDVAGITPSDFPLVALTQAELDGLPVAAGQVQDLYPLSPMQRGMLFHSLYEAEAGHYINQLRIDVDGLDVARFRAAWQGLVDQHEVLRSVFVTALEQPLQIVLREVEVPFVECDARMAHDQRAWLDARAAEERSRGFVLDQGPLLRLAVARTGAHSHQLIYTCHHILMDGWSTSRMLGEVLQRYSGQVVPRQAGRYRDYIAWLQDQDGSAAQRFWSEQLRALEAPTRLSTALVTPRAGEGYGDHGHSLDAELTLRLGEFAREHRVTLNTLVQAAWLLLLQRYTGQSVVVFGATVAGRPTELAGIEEQLGLFINTLPVLGCPRPEQRVGQWLAQVQAGNVALREYEHTPLNDIQRWAGHGGEALFDSILVFENYPVSEALEQAAPQGLVFGALNNQEQAHYPLALVVNVGTRLSMRLGHDRTCCDAAQAAAITVHLEQLLRALIEDAQAPLGSLSLLTEGEREQLLQGFNPSPVIFPEAFVPALVEARAQATPEAVAVILGELQLSYADLDRQANRLARHLLDLGVGPDVLVGISLERSLEMVVGLLAILKAGGAYVPLDPAYPRERLDYMVGDSGIRLLLTHSSLQVGEGVRRLDLDTAIDWKDHVDVAPVQVAVDPDHLAYVIYTSGSTGRPKGVEIRHGALANHMLWMQDELQLTARDRVLQKTAFSFDASVWEFWLPLINGAQLVLASPALSDDLSLLWSEVERHAVSVLQLAPSVLQALLPEVRSGQLASLRTLACGGEALSAVLVEQLREQWEGRLYNLYGPTEATIDTSSLLIEGAVDSTIAAIGRPIANVRTYVLDANLQPCPLGSAGELYVGGDALARGYHGRADLSAERFVPDPFTPGARLYRTGDLVRYRADGVIDYLGRIDHQVKIRGLRIELGEIEAVIRRHAEGRDVVVLANATQLLAYLVGAPDEQWVETLKARLGEDLPAFMVPAHWLFLEQLPLTPNGKLDRKALPQPGSGQAQVAWMAPRSELEMQLAAIWAEVLKVERVGLHDNFFELGGDSIISIQVVSRARHAGIFFTPKDLFQRQTVQSLAAVARLADATAIEQGAVQGEAPLTPVQQGFFDSPIPTRHHWNQAVLLQPARALVAAPLQQALRALLAHHDALRLAFVETDGGWQARHVASSDEALLWLRPLAYADDLEPLVQEAQRSLDLQRGHLLRAVLAELPDGTQRLLLVIHHLVVDGVSWRILLEDLQQAYAALLDGQPVTLPRKTSAFKHWGEHLRDYAQGAALEQELAYWQAQLADASDELPLSHRGGELTSRHVSSVSTRLDREATRQLLQDAPAAYRTQINDLLLTALARVLCQWTGQPSSLIKLEGHGREDLFDDLDITRTVGWFTSIYPVKLSPQADLAGSIKTVKEQLRAIPNKGIGYGVLRHLGSAEARSSLAALAKGSIVFNYLGQFDGSFAAEDALFVPASESRGDMHSIDAPLDSLISVSGQVYGGELELNWRFSTAAFEPALLQDLAERYGEELRQLIEHCLADGVAGATPSDFPLARLEQAQIDRLPVAVAEIADIYPLSPMQQGMLFHTLYEKAAGNYVNQMRVDVEGLDVARFQAAWQALVDQHDVLRAAFVSDLERPLQVIRKQVVATFAEQDWRGRDHSPEVLKAWADGDRQRGFDLEQEALLRLTLLRTGDERHHLVYTSHHILMDGWSNSRLLGEVLQRYHGQAPALSAARYRDYIEWLQRQDAAASQRFWSEQLAVLDAPTRLAQVLKPDGAASGYVDLHYALDREDTRKLGDFAREQRVTLNTLVQAAWLLLLQRYSGQASVTFGATVAGRPAELAGIEEQLGLFINTLPVVGSPRAEQSVADFVRQVQDFNLALREHEHTPLYDIQRWAGQGGEALFDNILVFENYPVSEALQAAAPAELRFGSVITQEQTHYPLTLVVQANDTLAVRFNFDRQRFSETGMARLAGHFDQLLRGLVADAAAPLGELPMLDAEERQQVTERWNDTAVAFDAGSVHELIEAQVWATPDAIAVRLGERTLDYAALDRQANRLAHRLVALGVGPDVLVGVSLERSLELVVGLLAILKAGGAYVPLDPAYPSERLDYMLRDSGVELLLTRSGLHDNGVERLDLDLAIDWADHGDVAPLQVPVHADNLAYVIYTSGSTGRPKGVEIRHGALSNHMLWMQGELKLTPQDRVLQKTAFSFDASVWEFWLPLLNGAQLVLATPALSDDLALLWSEVEGQRISVLQLAPSVLQALLPGVRPGQLDSLRTLAFGGEALGATLVEQLRQRWGGQVYNLYGPTEATIDTSSLLIEGPVDTAVAAIGRPIANVRTYVLDGNLQACAPGSAGELYVGGDSLARGYHGRADLTAERFVPDPFTPGARLYRTGDLVRQRADGVIDYLGRIDHQVKLRGLRIELGEIEALILAYPAVREAVVLARDNQLVAYVVADGAPQDELKALLARDLPGFMVPAQWLFLAQLPLTPSGKLDRKALPQADTLQSAYVAPVSELEQQLAAIWQEVLQVERVGLADNFFELGGHSLLAVQMLVRIRDQLRCEIALRELFEKSTLGDLCAVVEAKRGQVDHAQDELTKSLEALKRLSAEEIDNLLA
ncbi:amino acid adenylation domain-containing protein [Pseudomonas sp. 148P]|uniref:Amino acid adenylation domain-containing protein n=1 Tax=Pseudomonas ulcerans TaxID=3115852 RepID=A0ABU7HYQ5_9PSED|nr:MULTISPECIES: amino acid adenylation domain-containing protein [unclassified Pseudomonas]MEE1925826.1 amino acid adenylation domain-containing protein [Pseudomonas sp. 147P]MEE1936598.1 amino acid adenylation domain-containing protein [Pseudomonas sp. 148P]